MLDITLEISWGLRRNKRVYRKPSGGLLISMSGINMEVGDCVHSVTAVKFGVFKQIFP